MFTILVAVLTVIVVGYTIKSIIKPKNYPPGPRWYPFIGSNNVVQRMTKIHGSQWKGLFELSKKYRTQVLGLKLGTDLVVVVYGEKNVRQTFIEKEFEGRPNTFFLRLRCLGKRLGITCVDGPLWREHRNFTVKQLRNVGFGKTPMEKVIQSELLSVLAYIENNRSKPISPRNIFSIAVMNVLWKYVAGESIEKEKLKRLLKLFEIRSRAFGFAGGLLNLIPWCRFFIPGLSGYTLITQINKQISDIIEEAIQKHINNETAGNDFIYAFLEEMKTNKATFTYEQLKVTCLDLFIAGSQTTGNSLEFAVLVVLRDKKIQEKICDEIDKTIGDATPQWTDNSRLVYTSAFLLELQRYYSMAPMAGPRRVLQETMIDGYNVPKETTVLISLGDLHFDPRLWDEPRKFKPERFIDENGKLKISEHLYPFGLGRRRCPGDSLARSFIFITFVGIMQKYRIHCSNGVLPSPEPIIGLIAAAKPYTAEFTPRNVKDIF